MRVYNQYMHNSATTDAEYIFAARKTQDSYPYLATDSGSYPTYPAGDYVPGYHPPAPTNSYFPETHESIGYTAEHLAAQQYYQQQAANPELYYNMGRHHGEGEEFITGYEASNEGYHSTSSSGRPSLDRSPLPSSPECQKYVNMFVQSPNGSMMQRGDNSALLCAVCGDNAACQHYGVRTCEGCKGFFKRTVQKKAKYVCLAEKKCPVDKRRRNRCQFCRFQKCLAVGMVKEVVRSDSLKGRRGRLPSKPKTPNDKPVAAPLPLITTLMRAHLEQATDIPNFLSVGGQCKEKELISELLDHLTQTVNVIKIFFTRGNGAFSELYADDKDRISQLRSFHFFLLRYAQRIKVNVDMITLPNGTTYHRSQLQGTMGDIIRGIADFAVDLQRSEIDLPSFSCMLILSVLTERNGLKGLHKIQSAESKVIDSLRDHCTYNPEAQNRPHLYSRVISLMDPLDSLSQLMVSRLHQCIVEHSIPVPSQISLLFQFKHQNPEQTILTSSAKAL
ncbi:probable nuclear hormone receptor HR38 [Watersipora subatra]|uniref:probable nuclear hormone receptor HR38 n=1 Tax=Watersipora subatra TaxID=2589382 RepID=UPI00355BC377